MSQDPASVLRAFVERIDARGVAGRTACMTEDRRSVDAAGAAHVGREGLRAG